MTASRRAFACLLFVAVGLALDLVNVRGPLVIAAAVVVGLTFGYVIGEWWAVALPLMWLVLGLDATDADAGVLGTVVLLLVIVVPIEAALVAAGVAARRLHGRHALHGAAPGGR